MKRRLTNCANVSLSSTDSFKLNRFSCEVWDEVEAYLSLYDPLRGFNVIPAPRLSDYVIGEMACEEWVAVETVGTKPETNGGTRTRGTRVDLAGYEAAKEKHRLSIKEKTARRASFDATCLKLRIAIMERDWDTAMSLITSLKYPYQKDLVRIVIASVKKERELLKPAIERARRADGARMIKEGLSKLF